MEPTPLFPVRTPLKDAAPVSPVAAGVPFPPAAVVPAPQAQLPVVVTEQQIAALGAQPAKEIANISEKLAAVVRVADTDEFGDRLNQLVAKAKGLNPQDLHHSGSLINRMKNLLGSVRERFMAEYHVVAQQMDALGKAVDNASRQQIARMMDLDAWRTAVEQEIRRYDEALPVARSWQRALEQEIAQMQQALPPGDAIAAQHLADKQRLLTRLEKRIEFVDIQRTSAGQLLAQISLEKETAQMQVDDFENVLVSVIPAWQTQFGLRIIAAEQRKNAELSTSIKDAGNEAMRQNAEFLRQNINLTADAANRGVADIETLEAVHRETVGALADMAQKHQAARQKRIESAQKMEVMRRELNAALTQQQ